MLNTEPICHREHLHGGVRTGAAARSREDLLKVNRPVEAETSIGKDVDPVALVVAGRVQDGDLRDAFTTLDSAFLCRKANAKRLEYSHHQPARNTR